MKLRAVALAAAAAVLGIGSAAGATRAATATPSPRCTTAQLRISLAPVSGGLEHAGVALEFRDRGPICTLEGYPGVAGLSPAGATVFNAHRTLSGYLAGARGITLVTLSRGETASAVLEWLDVSGPGLRCSRYGQLEVTPPGATRSVRVHVEGRLCGPVVHPVVPGRRGGAGA